jgi:hypothetical protein
VVSPVHRWSGRLAFLVSIPVAMHCLYALGFQAFDLRVLVHSLLGCGPSAPMWRSVRLTHPMWRSVRWTHPTPHWGAWN